MNKYLKIIFFIIIPFFILGIFCLDIFFSMMPRRDKPGQIQSTEFGKLPVLLNGRIQPFDSVARNSLLQIRSTGDVPLEQLPRWQFWKHPKKLRSSEWLLEVMFKPEMADTRPVFLIHHPELIGELKLGDKGIEKSGLRYYTFNEIASVIPEVNAQARQANDIEGAQRTTYQKQVLKLANAMFLYQKLKNTIQREGMHDFAGFLQEYRDTLGPGVAAFRAQQAGQAADTAVLQKLGRMAQVFDELSELSTPHPIPPRDPAEKDGWVNVGTAMLSSMQTGEIPRAVELYARMASAYTHDKVTEFNSAIAEYKNFLAPHFSKELRKGSAEFYFNQVKFFLHATIIYICAFVLAGGALLTWGVFPTLSESMRRSSYYLIGLACVVHTIGLVFRMALEGRPPVTNLYSSAIFIGWGACVLGLILERFYKAAIGCAVAGLAGFITLLIAHNLALGGDTMEMMQAVLDTNFWLATHVVVVTLGYAATFVAGTLAMAYVILGIFTPVLRNEVAGPGTKTFNIAKALAGMVYAIICFATLFSFTGTVLGGIWADQSWGRFWGWDPKENGALLIVLWNALILHARWGGLVRERGLMNLAIFGNVITAWSWFGVNMLGIGLHSYGFMDSAFKWLMLFNASQVVLILLGALPLRIWRSFQTSPSSAQPA
jgi:ABC-type transport system involved in cytochrome c biogenesis permease subunit